VNYSKDQFFDLMTQAEEQGAAHRDEACTKRTYDFDGLRRPVTIRGCGNSTLFDVPYESIVADARPGVVERVCAVDDAMGRWPRFGGDRYAKLAADA
jgi:hypothetical protein